MTARKIRVLLVFVLLPLLIGIGFQNCSKASFKKVEAVATTDSASTAPNAQPLLCDDGAASQTVKWQRVTSENFEEPGQCAFGGNLTLIYEKNQKLICDNGKYSGTNEFVKGNLIGQKGACNCEGGVVHGQSIWKVLMGQTLNETKLCPVNGTLNLIYEKEQKYTCDNGKLVAADVFQKGKFLRQEGACNCANGSAEGSSSFQLVPNSTIAVPGLCTYGGNLLSQYEKLQQYLCLSSLMTAQNNFIKGNLLSTTGGCNCDGGIINGGSKYTVLAGDTIVEPVACKYGGNLVNVYEKKQKYLCANGIFSSTTDIQKGIFLRQQGACNPQPVLTESFNIAATKSLKPMDMIWVVDNSASMCDSAANVRKNIGSFISNVDSNLDMKFMMVSAKGNAGTGIILPASLDPKRFVQYDVTISSSKAAVKVIAQLDALASAGSPFFRTDSKKMIVFVTDDDSSISANTFMSELARHGVSSTTVSIFGFIGLGAASPCQAQTGNVYKNLATQTNGKVFNVCQIDWTQYFVDLKTEILTKLGRKFTMTAPVVATITKIEVDGVALSTNSYSYLNGVISLSEDVKLTELSVVKIFYLKDL